MTTTIYLDVDGVLNALTRFSPPPVKDTGWDEWETKTVNGWPILWAPELIEALNELAARQDVEFKWLTTWTNEAAKVLSPAIGINGQGWDILHGDQHAWGGERGWWKLEAIRADVEANSIDRFIWIDDDLGMERPALDWLATLPGSTGISPVRTEGITRAALRIITEFIDARIEEPA